MCGKGRHQATTSRLAAQDGGRKGFGFHSLRRRVPDSLCPLQNRLSRERSQKSGLQSLALVLCALIYSVCTGGVIQCADAGTAECDSQGLKQRGTSAEKCEILKNGFLRGYAKKKGRSKIKKRSERVHNWLDSGTKGVSVEATSVEHALLRGSASD